jgi:23S rRNA pseudouridine2605 synthase
MAERIQKVLARAGVASRRQVEEWIRAGRLAVNGAPASLGAKLGPRDKVTLDGRPVRRREPESATRVVIYHRSPGRELGTSDSAESPHLLEHLPKRAGRRWVPVSPLPPNDGGLELLTSDGDLAQSLMRRLATLRIVFSVRVRGTLNEEQLTRLRSGIVDDHTQLQIESIESAGGEGVNRWYTFTTRGGRARDLHRLLQACGVELSRLMRVGLGPVRMDRDLARERHRALTPAEAQQLYELAGVSSGASPVKRPPRKGARKPRQAAAADSTRSRPRSLARYKA